MVFVYHLVRLELWWVFTAVGWEGRYRSLLCGSCYFIFYMAIFSFRNSELGYVSCTDCL